MNYLKRMDSLYRAISEKYKNGSISEKERDAKFDEIKLVLDNITGLRADIIKKNVDNLVKGKDSNNKGSRDRLSEIRDFIVRLNEICADNEVDPVFPEVEPDTDRNKIPRAIQRYMDQLTKSDQLLRDAREDFCATNDYDKFISISDYITNHIDQMMDDKEDIPDPDDQGPDEDDKGAGFPFEMDDPLGMGHIDPEKYLINLNKRSGDNGAMFRDSVLNQTISCLIGRSKPNALLIGAAGVGKTIIAEEIAHRLEKKDRHIPDQLKGYTIWELPLSNIVSGSGIVGDVEKKLRAVLDYARDPEKKVILFIDEVHMLVSGMQSYDKMAQIMKPALARGDIKVIAATTLQEARNFMNDPAFNRRFTRIIVDELTQEQTVKLLKKETEKLLDHYNGQVTVEDGIEREIVSIADDFRTAGSHRPDNAITLLDRAMAEAVVDLEELKKGKKSSGRKSIELDRDRIRNTAMRLMTGNTAKTTVDIEELKKSLSVIKGQNNAVDYLIDMIIRDNLSVFQRKNPLTFLFAGSSGVGKTEVAKIMAEAVTGLKPIILNMTEFSSSSDVNRIVGSPVGYAGSDSKAELPFDILESNPYQVIVLDEFEKCDKAVQRLFMSAFDEGYINTAKGKVVDFSKSIIIATTNAGYSAEKNRKIGFSFPDDRDEKSIVELSEYYDVELLNRFTKILNFRPIGEKTYREILKNTYVREVKRIKASKQYEVLDLPSRLSDEETERLTKESYNIEFGARPVNRTIQKYIEDMILEKM